MRFSSSQPIDVFQNPAIARTRRQRVEGDAMLASPVRALIGGAGDVLGILLAPEILEVHRNERCFARREPAMHAVGDSTRARPSNPILALEMLRERIDEPGPVPAFVRDFFLR